MIPLFKVQMNSEISNEIDKVLMSGYIGQGKQVDIFEDELSKYCEHPYPVTVNSATSGLQLALRLAISDDDHGEVLTQPITCTATNWAILASGNTIRWVDTSPNDCNMDLNDLRRKISKNTKAIMVVHWGGYPNDLNELQRIQNECYTEHGNKPLIIEDASHAICAEFNKKQLGSHGNLVVYSFQAIKHLTSGDGGVILCPNESMYQRAKLLRWYGLDRTQSESFRCGQNISEWGYKFHMNDINATIGLHNLKLLPRTLRQHRDNNDYYRQELQDICGIKLLDEQSNRRTSSWIFTLRAQNRDDLQSKLTKFGIANSKVHNRNDKHKCVQKFKDIRLPGTDIMDNEMLCIPCGWWVTDNDRQYIVDTIKSGW